MARITARSFARLVLLALLGTGAVIAAFLAVLYTWTLTPGSSHRGPLPRLDDESRARATRLHDTVHLLAHQIGPRHYREPHNYRQAADHLEAALREMGYQEVQREPVPTRGTSYPNLVVERRGTTRPEEIVLVGAHYDSHGPGPGADDNASGTAAALEVARHFADSSHDRTLRIVLFANEEPPFFQGHDMGSHVHAKNARQRGDDILVMFSLEMLGYYQDEPGTQRYPAPLDLFYPDRGDFVAFVGKLGQGGAADRSIHVFRQTTAFPSEGLSAPGWFPGVDLSDHWSFWQHDYPAVMVTDTAFFRNHRYHTTEDTADSLDYQRMARVVGGLQRVVAWWLDGDTER